MVRKSRKCGSRSTWFIYKSKRCIFDFLLSVEEKRVECWREKDTNDGIFLWKGEAEPSRLDLESSVDLDLVWMVSGESRISQTESASPQGGGAKLLFGQFSPENCMKMKAARGRAWLPPYVRQWWFQTIVCVIIAAKRIQKADDF